MTYGLTCTYLVLLWAFLGGKPTVALLVRSYDAVKAVPCEYVRK